MTIDELLAILPESERDKASRQHTKYGNVCLLLSNNGRLLAYPWNETPLPPPDRGWQDWGVL